MAGKFPKQAEMVARLLPEGAGKRVVAEKIPKLVETVPRLQCAIAFIGVVAGNYFQSFGRKP